MFKDKKLRNIVLGIKGYYDFPPPGCPGKGHYIKPIDGLVQKHEKLLKQYIKLRRKHNKLKAIVNELIDDYYGGKK